jgi:hypothetical protein
MRVKVTAQNEIRLNRKEAGTGEGMDIVSPGEVLEVSEPTARELLTYRQVEKTEAAVTKRR